MPFSHFLILIAVVIAAAGATVWLAVTLGGSAALGVTLPIMLVLALLPRRASGSHMGRPRR